MNNVASSPQANSPQKNAIAYYRSAAFNPVAIYAQCDAMWEFADLHNIKIIHEEVDNGWSGLTTDRPGLQRIFREWILNDDALPFDYILLNDPSRFGRFQDPSLIPQYEYLCRMRGKEVIYISTHPLSLPS